MDGPWQICHKTAYEYARAAAEAAKLMKWVDPDIELVACGSSGSSIPTFGSWETTVLEETYEHADYISLHSYYGNQDGDLESFLASSMDMDFFIRSVVSMCDYIKAKKHSKKTVNLSYDEWNVWFHSHNADQKIEKWQTAPALLEDVYDLADAVVVGSLLITLLRHSDRVKIACLAQLVNVIAPIMTEKNGQAWPQTIFYPFFHASKYGMGIVLNPVIYSPRYDSKKYGDTPYVDAAIVLNEPDESLTVFSINRNLHEQELLELNLTDFPSYSVVEHIILDGAPDSRNTAGNTNNIMPRMAGCPKNTGLSFLISLPPLSWNVIRLRKAAI
jgi:alpha-N-arabinofuranosidase